MRITSIIRNYRGTKGIWVSLGKSKRAIPIATEELYQKATTYFMMGIEVEPEFNEKKQIINWFKRPTVPSIMNEKKGNELNETQ